jgi:hypothetical protein
VNYKVYRTFDDGTEEEITDHNQVTVSSAQPSDVSVTETSFDITGQVDAQDVTITATNNSKSGTIDVTVDAPADDQTTLSNPNTPTKGELQFDVDNTGADSIDISAIYINSSGQGDIVDNDGDKEFEGAGGSLDAGQLSIGSGPKFNLDTTGSVSGGTTETITVKEFRKSNNNKAVQLKNKNVKLTLFFGDGTKITKTFSVPS